MVRTTSRQVPSAEQLENELQIEASEATIQRIKDEQEETGKALPKVGSTAIFAEEVTNAEEKTLKKYNLFTENNDLSPDSFLEQQTNRPCKTWLCGNRQVTNEAQKAISSSSRLTSLTA